jgi:Asp/Glu/hydantoin racemase
MNQQFGGKTVFGASVGILMLETRFPRIYGDIGNAMTWPFPVQYKVVPGATAEIVVRQDPRVLLDRFVAAGRELVQAGCDGITTNCGFLALIQDQVKHALGVPVATSSLMQIPMVQALLPPGKTVGVLTISKATLTPEHLAAAGAPRDTVIVGTDGGRAFTTGILDDHESLDFEACRLDILDAAAELVTQHKGIGAIVLECTNMVPYAADVRKLTGLPVYSIYSFVSWFQAGLAPRKFPLELDDPRLNLASYQGG